MDATAMVSALHQMLGQCQSNAQNTQQANYANMLNAAQYASTGNVGYNPYVTGTQWNIIPTIANVPTVFAPTDVPVDDDVAWLKRRVSETCWRN